MRPYRLCGLLLVACALGFAVGYRVGEHRRASSSAPQDAAGAACCTIPTSEPAVKVAPPSVPTGSGLPCLVEFGSDECGECKRMVAVMARAETELEGTADTVRVDTDLHPTMSQRFRLRLIPTQVLVGADGSELWRHEGYLPAADLLKAVGDALGPHAASKTGNGRP